jgi:two-component system nitrate/nitrite response regulator NarL
MNPLAVRLTTVFACESQPIVIEGLRLALEACSNLLLVGAAPPERALAPLAELRPHLVLVGSPEDPDPLFAFLQRLRETCPDVKPVLWTREPERIDQSRALELGVRGILRRTLPAGVLLDCLSSVARGELWTEQPARLRPAAPRPAPRLTPRERDVVRLLCRGMKNKQIAEALAIAPGTVKVHLMHIFEKTGARNRYELAVGARRLVGGERGDPAGGDALPQ